MSAFKWTKQKATCAIALAEGHTIKEAAEQAKKDERSVYRWKHDIDFSQEVDRLSLMIGIASRAERLRIAQRIARQMVSEEGKLITEKDLLDWLKFAQSETDGIKLDLATLLDAEAPVAGSRPTGTAEAK